MKIRYILTLLAFFYANFCNSQEITGHVIDSESGEFIQFVNIGVVGTDIGTISELEGAFHLDLSNAADRDTLRFSFIGYKSIDFSINKIRENGLPLEIFLEEKIIELDEVIVSSRNLIPIKMGIDRKDCYPIPLFKKATSRIPFPQAGYKHEIGTLFTNKQSLYLDSLEFNFTDIQTDTVPLRVNIYVDVDGHFENILNKPIYINFQRNDESQRIDVSYLGLQINRNFLITIENYRRIEEKSLNILANFKSKRNLYPTYYRRNTQSDWISLKYKEKEFGISCIAYVRQ